MEFAFDPAKSAANLRKHGIDFLAAQALWQDPSLLEIPARTSDEERFLVIARLQGKHWSAVITYRQQVIRLISVRRSRPEEVQLYEQL
jgi:uncharacterized DUF497 family protein